MAQGTLCFALCAYVAKRIMKVGGISMKHMTLRARRRTAWLLAALLMGALWTGYAGTFLASVVLAESYIDALPQEDLWDTGGAQAPEMNPALPDTFEGPAVEGTNGILGASGDGGDPSGMDAGNDAGGILPQDTLHPPTGLSSSGEPISYGEDAMPDEADAFSDDISGLEGNGLPEIVDSPVQALPEDPSPDVPPEDMSAAPLPEDPAEGDAPLSDARVEYAAPDTAVVCVRGEPVTVAIPLVYRAPDGTEIRLDDPSVYAQQNNIASDSRHDPLLYGQDIVFYTDRVYVEPVADELFPLDRTGMTAYGTVVEHGLNHGYAMFEGLQVPQDMVDGEQVALFRVQWHDVGQDVMRETRIAVTLWIATETGDGAGMDDGETSGEVNADGNADVEGSLPVDPSGGEGTEGDGTAPEPADQSMPGAAESGVEESNAAKPDVENPGTEKPDETAVDEERTAVPETPEAPESPDADSGTDPQTDMDADTATSTDGKDEALPDEQPSTGETALPRVTLADTQKVYVSAGEMVRLALPLRYTYEETVCDTHLGPDGAEVSDVDAANGAAFGQDIGAHVSALWVQLEPMQFTAPDCAIAADDALLAPRKVVDGAHNAGYAVFDPVWVLGDVTPGDYPIHLLIHWTDTQGVVASYPQTMTLSVVAPVQEAAQDEPWDPQALLDALEIPPISLTLPQRADSLVDIRRDVPMATGEGMASGRNATGSLPEDGATDEAPDGDTVALAVPIAVHMPAGTLYTNSAPDGDASVPYRPEQTADAFTQQGLEALEGISLTLVDAPPLQLAGAAVLQPVVQDGINRGYALLEDAMMAPDAQPGEYTLTFEVRLNGTDTEAVRTLQVPLWLQMPVEAAVLADTMDIGILSVDAVSSATIRTDALDISITPGPVTLAVSVALRIDGTLYVTNYDAQSQPVSYAAGQGAAPFGQDIMQVVQSIVIEPDDTFADDAFAPFAASGLVGQSGTLAAAGENHGYAVFTGVTLLPDAFDATYALPFRVQITLADGTAVDPILCMLSLTLTGTGSAAETRYEVGLTGDPIVFSDGKDLAIPATFWLLTDPNERFTTNLDDQETYVPYGESAASFSQSIPPDFTRLSVALDPSQFGEADFPLSVSGMQAGPVLLDGGVNNGYAAIGGLARKPDSAFGTYTVQVIFSWHEGGRKTAYTKVVPMTLEMRPSAVDLATAGQVSIDPVSV